jgi:hypothetical protein
VLNELDQIGAEGHDLTTYLREYIEGLGRAHGRLREMWSTEAARWEKTIQEAIERYRTFGDGSVLGMIAVARDAAGKWQEKVAIFDDPIQRLRHLRTKNALLVGISRRYVSNELP